MLTAEPIKEDGKCMHVKLKTWKERIETNFHGKDVPYNMYCNVTAVHLNNEKTTILRYTLKRYTLKSVNKMIR